MTLEEIFDRFRFAPPVDLAELAQLRDVIRKEIPAAISIEVRLLAAAKVDVPAEADTRVDARIAPEYVVAEVRGPEAKRRRFLVWAVLG